MKQIAMILYSSQEDEIDLPYPSIPRVFKIMVAKLCLHFWAKCRGGLVLMTFKRGNIRRPYLHLCTAPCSYITSQGQVFFFFFFVSPSNKSDSLGMFNVVVVFWKFNSTTSGASANFHRWSQGHSRVRSSRARWNKNFAHFTYFIYL